MDGKVLIAGAGSIGRRHAKNLTELGVGPVGVADPDRKACQTLCEDINGAGFETLNEGLNWNPDVVFICTPSHLHLEQALRAARAGCDLFVEKPLAHEPDQALDVLLKEVNDRGLTTMVGCNMRFHPGPRQAKNLIERGAVGNVHFARIHTGTYLPEWRPRQDYRESYSANKQMGGGCILDCIHEIDLARWYLGSIERVFCNARQQSSLEMDVEDVAALICDHPDGAISEIHLDYVQRTYERGCQIVGERGSIFWDYSEAEVCWYDAENDNWECLPQPEDWEANQMYVDEIEHFLDSVRESRRTTQPVDTAAKLMNAVFAAKKSVHSGKMEDV